MGSAFGRVGLEEAIEAEALSGGAEQGEQDDRERAFNSSKRSRRCGSDMRRVRFKAMRIRFGLN